MWITRADLQVSLRDAIRSGMQESELQQVISDAVREFTFLHLQSMN